MPYKQSQYGKLTVEEEHTRTTLRIMDDSGKRVFACEVTATGPVTARVTNASGRANLATMKAVVSWMRSHGYVHFSFERNRRDVKRYDIPQKIKQSVTV